MMKKFIIFMVLLLSNSTIIKEHLQETEYVPVEVIYYSNLKLEEEYIDKYLKIAIQIEQETGVPVDVQFAVDILETGFKKKLKYNNSGNVTCKCNYNKKIKHKNECYSAYDKAENQYVRFVKYKTETEAWKDKARIISNYSWFLPNQPFNFYAKRLQGCYATSKSYTRNLKSLKNKYFKNIEYGILRV